MNCTRKSGQLKFKLFNKRKGYRNGKKTKTIYTGTDRDTI